MAQSYMFLIYGDESAFGDTPPSPEDFQHMLQLYRAFADRVAEAGGKILSGEALAPTSSATTIRPATGSDALVTDGPFAETKEALGGYYLIECANLDQALEFAKALPTTGCVEVRPTVDTSSS